jgi:hypothetical protein
MEAILASEALAPSPSKIRRRAGFVLSGLPVAFLLFDSAIKLAKIRAVVEGSAQLGFSEWTARPLGLILLACVLCYLLPRTAVLGAALLTGYLGGAIAAHLRVGDPLFSHTLFPVYVALLLWGGLYLRNGRVQALAPWGNRGP